LYLPIATNMQRFYSESTQDSGDQEAAVAMGGVFLAAQESRPAGCDGLQQSTYAFLESR